MTPSLALKPLESAEGGPSSHVAPRTALDPFQRWNPLAAPLPVGEARELPLLSGWAQWDLAVRLLQNNPLNPLASVRGPDLE